MNHAVATHPPAHTRAILCIYQYLKSRGYEETASILELESKISENDPNIPEHDILLNAITYYDDKQLAFKQSAHTQQEDDVDQTLASLSLVYEPVCTTTSTSHMYHTSNIITCQFNPHPDIHVYASGGVDKTIQIVDYENNRLVSSLTIDGPVLAVDFHPTEPTRLLAACMNGHISIVNYQAEKIVEQIIADHRKYVIAAKWSPDGQHFATASHDCTVNFYGPGSGTDPERPYRLEHHLEFRETVEAICWINPTTLYISVRGDNCLHAYDITTYQRIALINLNATGDNHVSFTALHLSISPNKKFLLVSTDRHRAIMLLLGTSTQVKNFYGILNDGYSSPRHTWSSCGRYIYATSQDKSIIVWDVTTARVIHTLTGHEHTIRDVCHHPKSPLLISCSYDKTVRVWKPEIA